MSKKLIIIIFISVFVLAPFTPRAQYLFSRAETTINYQKITTDTTWNLAGSPYLVYFDSIQINEGVTLTIEPGVIVKLAEKGLTVKGNLIAQGTIDQPIIFTSINDDFRGGKSADWSSGNPQAGDWESITIDGNGRLVMDHAIINYGGTKQVYQAKNDFFQAKTAQAFEVNTGALVFVGQECAVSNTEISQNKIGILANTASQITLNNLSIFANSEGGLVNYNEAIIDAANTWWGDNSGPYHETLNPSGSGNSVSDNVLFDPWIGKSEIDPLILKYEPILYLHPDENYQPMSAEEFVANSSLWDANGSEEDVLLNEENTADPVGFDDLSKGEETADWYLQFVRDLTDKEPDPAKAKVEYDALKASGQAKPTYYAYKMEDSYTDENNVTHEFIVLQYWYFYAFNDWKAQVGSLFKFANNHEGDWEVVMIFLDKSTKEPKYVAYSAHHNEGEVDTILQYDSVRRGWSSAEIEKQNNQVVSYVALGSHANYPNNGNNGTHEIGHVTADDKTSSYGPHLMLNDWNKKESISLTTDWIAEYKGKWGVIKYGGSYSGSNGPEGPIDRGKYTKMFLRPVEWSGINKIQKKVVEEQTSILDFLKQKTKIIFGELLSIGTEVEVDRHDEVIDFGDNLENNILLPGFWDIESNLANNTFNAEVSFGYDETELSVLNVTEKDLLIMYYNPGNNVWTSVPSVISSNNNTISFTTNHFSRYAIGAKNWQDISDKLKIQKLPGGYNNKTGEKTEYVRLKNITQDKISGTLRLVVSDYDKDGITLTNNTGTTTDGLLYLETEDYANQCSYIGEPNKELPKWKMILGKLIKNRSLSRIVCDQTIRRNPELKDKFEYYLAPGQYGEAVPMQFSLPIKKTIKTPRGSIYIPEFLWFDFELKVMKNTD